MGSAHVIPCVECGGTGLLTDGHPHDPCSTDIECESCGGEGEFPCDGSCDRDECADDCVAMPYVVGLPA